MSFNKFLLLIAFVGFSGIASAGGNLQVKTTLVKVVQGSKAGSFSLANTGDAPVSAQIKVMRWTQVNGMDVTEPDDNIVVSPSITTIGGDQEKIVRLIRKNETPAGDDVMYRILVQQIPGADKTPGVQILMNYSVPLYMLGENPSKGELTCKKSGNDLICSNSSGHAQRLGATRIKNGDTISNGLLGYVLPKSIKKWPGVLKGAPSKFELISSVNGEDITISVEDPL